MQRIDGYGLKDFENSRVLRHKWTDLSSYLKLLMDFQLFYFKIFS